jgi:hypothetical protein
LLIMRCRSRAPILSWSDLARQHDVHIRPLLLPANTRTSRTPFGVGFLCRIGAQKSCFGDSLGLFENMTLATRTRVVSTTLAARAVGELGLGVPPTSPSARSASFKPNRLR